MTILYFIALITPIVTMGYKKDYCLSKFGPHNKLMPLRQWEKKHITGRQTLSILLDYSWLLVGKNGKCI